jgi:hypothetical protein
VRLPHPILLRLVLRRGVVLWVSARLALLAVGLMAKLVPVPATYHPGVSLGPAGTPWFLLLLGLVTWLDLRRRRELTLIANLGLRPGVVSAVACAPAVVGEFAVMTLVP